MNFKCFTLKKRIDQNKITKIWIGFESIDDVEWWTIDDLDAPPII